VPTGEDQQGAPDVGFYERLEARACGCEETKSGVGWDVVDYVEKEFVD
jgi:hypothetical protein